MSVEITTGNDYLTAVLEGEIDQHWAAEIRTRIDAMLEELLPLILILDFENVTFMDSSGIGLILGRKRVAESLGCRVLIKNPSRYAEKIIRLAGLSSMIIPEKKKGRTK